MTDVLRELTESSARALNTTPEAMDAAWDRAVSASHRRELEALGITRTDLMIARELRHAVPVALPPAPLRPGTKAVPSSDEGAGGLQLLPAWDVGRPKYPRQSVANWRNEGYRKNEIAFACVLELAQSATEPRLRVKLSLDPEAPWVDDHPAAAFARRPHPRMVQRMHTSQTISLGAIAGNAVAWIERTRAGRVFALHWLRSDRIKLSYNVDGTVRSYWYNNGIREVELKAENVFHFPWAFDPFEPWWGLSPFGVLARQVSIDNTTTDFQAKFFEQAGVPYGLISTEQLLNPDDADAIADRWQQRYSGMEGWHKPAVLGQGATYQRMALNMSEMQLDELRAIPEARICSAFQVPPILVGAKVGLDRSTFANYGEARKSFWQETLRPLYGALADAWNLYIAPEFGSDVVFAYDLSDVGALQVDETEKWGRAGKAFTEGWVSDNEARVEVGLNPWPQARRVLTIAMIPEDAPDAEGGDPGSGRTESRARGSIEGKVVPIPTRKAAGADDLNAALARSQRALVPPFEKRVERLYRGIARRVVDRLGKSAGKAWAGQLVTGTRTWSDLWTELKQSPLELLPEAEREAIETELRRFRALVGEATFELLNALYPLGATFAPGPEYYARASADARTMYETLQDRVREVLATAEERGWSTEELIDGDESEAGLEAAIAGSDDDDRDGVHVLAATAALVGVAQYVTSRNDASTLAYEQGGVEFVDVSDGTDHDAECAEADGQRWTLDEALENPSEHPNCVRSFVPVFERES